MCRKLQLAVGAAVAAAVVPPAGASAGPGTEYSFGLSSRQPGTPTGMSIRALYRHPRDPAAKPPQLREVILEMPAGLRFDTGVLPSCEASDDELRLRGREACPGASRLGSGSLTAVTGIPGADPVEADLTLFNGGDELVELVSFKGTDVTAGSDRLRIEGGRLVAHPPQVPGGPPDGRTTVREIAFTIQQRVTGGRSFVTTPPGCRPEGSWSSRLSFTFASYGTGSAVGRTPCAGRTAVARMRLSVSPRRVRAGRPARFRVRVRSGTPACRSGVRVRLGGKRVLTSERGRATINARFRRPGRRAVRAAKRGCRPARAWIRVR